MRFFKQIEPSAIDDHNFMKEKITNWKPLIDITGSVLESYGDESWSSELSKITGFISKHRNFSDKPEKGYEIGCYSITIGKTPANDIAKICQNFLGGIKVKDYPYDYPPIVFCTEGINATDPRYHEHTSFPTKIHMGNSFSSYLEINLPLVYDGNTVRILKESVLPTEILAFFDNFDPEKGGKLVFLTHHSEASVAMTQNVFQSMQGGENFRFPAWLDVSALWVKFGSWAHNSLDPRLMQTWITGGTVPNADCVARLELPLDNLMDWELSFMASKHRMIIMLYAAFTPINLPRLFPSRKAVANQLNQDSLIAFVRIFNSVITESSVYEEINLQQYTVEKDLKRSSTLFTEMPSTLSTKSRMAIGFNNLWPTKLSCPVKTGWECFTNPDLLEEFCLLLAKNAQFYTYPPDLMVDDEMETDVHEIVQEYQDEQELHVNTESRIDYTSKDNLMKANDLGEVLRSLASERKVAWNRLHRLLSNYPDVMVNWLDRASRKNQMPSESTFKFQRYKDFRTIQRLAKEFYPVLDFPNEHQGIQHRGGRKLKQGWTYSPIARRLVPPGHILQRLGQKTKQ